MERRAEPYRSAWIPAQTKPRATFDSELFSVYAIVWVGSIARVLLGVLRHEPFAIELSLATLAIAALPYAALMKS